MYLLRVRPDYLPNPPPREAYLSLSSFFPISPCFSNNIAEYTNNEFDIGSLLQPPRKLFRVAADFVNAARPLCCF